MRFAVDTGGTFTDLVVDDGSGRLRLFKSSTTTADPIQGVLDVLSLAASDYGLDRAGLLGRGELFIHGTTRAINAVLTGATARTAFLTTKGHPDVLLFREGGRRDLFNWRDYPDPYVPRALTFEVPERIGAQGEIVVPLDEPAVVELCGRLAGLRIEAVAVCLLWSTVNATHEQRVGALLEQHLPGVPATLSHALNPTLREYRRASSAAIDASLKPVMSAYLRGLDARLAEAGFRGRVLVVGSGGGLLDAEAMAEAPIHSLGSGPAMAPVAGRHYARLDAGAETVVVADTGGTSYDVSLVRRGRIPWTRETWLGEPYMGHMTGFPSIDVKSIGAGGGSIASVDAGGLLHVGPASAGAEPGPACYGRGGTRPTVTDACLVLGYLDPAYFLGGAMPLDLDAARRALDEHVAQPLGLDLHRAAAAVLEVATEHMAQAIEEITVAQGIDPREAVLIGGGGAAGLNAVAIARRLGCARILIPDTAAALSAAGALMSDLRSEHAATFPATTATLDLSAANRVLAGLVERCEAFAAGPGAGALETRIELSAEARYPSQNWEIDVPLRGVRFEGPDDVARLREDFHATHRELFAIDDPESEVEIVGWRARVSCRLRDPATAAAVTPARRTEPAVRRAWFRDAGLLDAAVVRLEELALGESIGGPAIIESAVTTVVVEPGASAERTASGGLSIVPGSGGRPARAAARAEGSA